MQLKVFAFFTFDPVKDLYFLYISACFYILDFSDSSDLFSCSMPIAICTHTVPLDSTKDIVHVRPLKILKKKPIEGHCTTTKS